MKISKALIVLMLFLMLTEDSFSQTGELTIWQTNNASTIDVSLYLKRTGDIQWSLGYGSFVVKYNFSAMNTPVEIGEGIWDNNTNTAYDDQTVASYNSDRSASVEIGLAGGQFGTPVPTDSMLLGTIRFTITNPVLTHNLQWNADYTSIIDDNGNDITANMTFVNASNGLLPVELTSFTSNVNANNVYLRWTTSSEINNAGFEIQRREFISKNWEARGYIDGNINSSEPKVYEFIDRGIEPGIYNYRLRQSDINGNFEYFELADLVSISNPERFELFQNFPNPFNPSTIITYKITEPGSVRLILYDALGKSVKELVNEFLEAGYHQYELDATGLGSGVYYYRLESGNSVDVKSMLLLK